MSSGVTTTLADRTRNEHLSHAVVRAVADAEGVDPTELDTPLYEAVDPDALDALYRENENSVTRMQFAYYGYRVTVHGDAELEVEKL